MRGPVSHRLISGNIGQGAGEKREERARRPLSQVPRRPVPEAGEPPRLPVWTRSRPPCLAVHLDARVSGVGPASSRVRASRLERSLSAHALRRRVAGVIEIENQLAGGSSKRKVAPLPGLLCTE